jgi:glutamyl-Q tRNA(Asp) synthetase
VIAAAPARAAAAYRGRFAPSPTGPLHFGSLVAALASYCDARAASGQWLVRMEDVDEPRCRAAAAAGILATLERYGFEWDGPVVRQSDRTLLYEAALARLTAEHVAYPCACTRRELEAVPARPSGERVYPGTCRDGIPAAHAGRRQRAWRVRTGDAVIAFVDRAQHAQQQDLALDVGDFVVRRADGLFAYQLAVVVDDAAQGISCVVRGADLLSSTARQIMLQRLLGLPTPTYLHVPVALNPVGEKLSKQTHARPLPDAPMPALLAAWRFLDQEAPDVALANPREFWAWAAHTWRVARVPPVATFAAPTGVAPAPCAEVPDSGRV